MCIFSLLRADPEAELIDDIVEELLVKLNHMPHSSYHDDLSNTVGIREHIKNFVSLYFDKPTKKDYQIIGMWGMFGIGKTTIAKGVYNRVISQFEHHYFLENVSEKAKTQRSSSDLKDELFAGLLGEESLKLGRGGGGAATTASSGSTFAKLRRFRTKVLIVLDGVENEKQYNDILSPKDIQFSNGSIIIVTSRSEQVLMNIKAGEMYHVRALNDEEADHLYYLQTSTTGESSVGISEEDTELLRKKVKDCASGVPEHLGNLKKINLSYSEQLTHISHLSENMEIINLECCTGLVELPSLLEKLSKLTYLNLNNCSNLGKLPTFPKNIKNLEMRRCENLNTLPNNISHMKELECVNLSGCTKLSRFPGISKPMNRLTVLILDGTPIKELPSSICNLIKLQILSLNMCQLLQVLPETISSLDYLEKLSICHCSNLKSLPKLSSSVSWVDARCCQKLEKVDMTTSKLLTHVVSNNDTNTNYKEGKFAFYNCPNLDHESHQNLMFEAQLRILSSAKRTKDIVRNKIPDWFEYNNEGDEINVPLPWSWCNHKFLGFAFCVVVEFWDSYSFDSDFKLLCKSECIFPGAEFFDRWRRIWTWQCNYTNPDYHHDIKNTHHNRVKKSSHIFLFYDYGSHKYFDFQVQCNGNSGAVASSSGGPNERQDEFSSCQVKCCGVRLLYDEDHVNLSRRGDHHDHILTREVSEIVQDRQNSTMEIVQRSNTMMSSSSHRNMPSSLYNNHHQITQFTSFHCFQFCPNFAEICDCLLGKRPEIVKNPCGCSQELMKMMKELKEDMDKVNSRMDRILLQQNHNRVPQPISI
ncbi:hypothetical protein F8388_025866 [Cannabis sativa]|uniref:ADP-ribosyl cyclase/cyclic ADP-ribose hydrolase n=1 Tax=Cannabis sativa TaxID=3483 RepID=A0A7J6FA23_CANSA|nr:hypothetical protein F8388_025866 [Cannabis sativa]